MKKAIVLAAGKGTRMKSSLPKVLHLIGGRPMILEQLKTLQSVQIDEVVVVVGPDMPQVGAAIHPIQTVVQTEQLGTANAALAAKDEIGTFDGPVLVLFGDHPLTTKETFLKMIDSYNNGNAVTVVGFEPKNPARYGRLVMGASGLQEIVEFKDATPEQQAIGLCNSGYMCLDGKKIWDILGQIKNNNAASEYYLTDAVKIARQMGFKTNVVIAQEREVMGINTKMELLVAEEIYQDSRRREALDAGATMLDPKTVYFSYDTIIEGECTIEPCVFFGSNVRVKTGAKIKAFTRLENTVVEKDVP